MTAVGIVGPGPAGVGLGFALSRAGHRVFLHGRQAKNLPVALDHTWGGHPPWLAAADVVLLAVPDHAIPNLVQELFESKHVLEQHVVLHLSGALDRTALTLLSSTGAALGSLHPVQSFQDPLTAPEQLKGSGATVEGDERAVEVASDLARSVGLHPIQVSSEQKVIYHAAEIMLSSFLPVLAAVGERLMREGGATSADVWQTLSPVLAATVERLRRKGTAASLSGPLARGEAETIRRHLSILSPPAKQVYLALTRAGLDLVRLPAEQRATIETALEA